MSQAFTDDCFAAGHQALDDLQYFENNFAALKSMFSGAAAPANLVAGMHWFDTTKKALKLRNNANDAWLGIMQADASHKIWVYRNTAPDGWAIDAAVTDVVLALKGGSNAYNANGGTQAGSWTQPDCTLGVANLPAHDHGSGGSHTHDVEGYKGSSVYEGPEGAGATTQWGGPHTWVGTMSWQTHNPTYYRLATVAAHTHTSVGSGSAHNHGTTYRPAAAIGTLQYMDL
jgi:hypothetical protein